MIEIELLWDDDTIEHIWRHRLRIEEVDEAFHDPDALIHTGRHRHQVVYGKTEGERYLTIIIEPLGRKGSVAHYCMGYDRFRETAI